MITVLKNGIIFTGERLIFNHALLLKDGKISGVVEENAIPEDAVISDCAGNFITAGLIDLQVYGGGGVLFSDAPSASSLHQMADALVKSGTTGFLITLATNSYEVFKKAIAVVKDNPHPAVLGLHFEGPYLNVMKKGAHLEEHIRIPEPLEVKELLNQADGVLKMMTVAPEVCSDEVLHLLNEKDVLISAGHSNAGFCEAMSGFRKGIRAATHLFNAMSPLHHRDTGLPGAVFSEENISASIIADGIHVAYDVVAFSKKILKERLFLITDAVEESRGVYTHIHAGDRFTLQDGTLSGSALTMLKAVQNCVNHAGISLEEALRMASVYPAALLGQKGRIAAGNDADLLIFDQVFSVKQVYLKGKAMLV